MSTGDMEVMEVARVAFWARREACQRVVCCKEQVQLRDAEVSEIAQAAVA